MKYFGWAIVILWVVASIDLIDFHICIAGHGECKCAINKGKT